MRFGQGVGDLHRNVEGFVEFQWLAAHPLRQRFPFDVLHDDEAQALVFSDLVDGADVGVIQPGGRPRFPDQAASRLLVRYRPGRQNLDGDFAP
jgi:hypothetical protein